MSKKKIKKSTVNILSGKNKTANKPDLNPETIKRNKIISLILIIIAFSLSCISIIFEINVLIIAAVICFFVAMIFMRKTDLGFNEKQNVQEPNDSSTEKPKLMLYKNPSFNKNKKEMNE